MRRFLSLILLFAFLLPQLAKVGIFISFKVNQEYIAKVLCINKDKPKMGCNGKCHLAKELNETENKGDNSPITVTDKIEITLFIEKNKPLQLKALCEYLEKRTFFDIEQRYAPSYIDGVFHPPQGILI